MNFGVVVFPGTWSDCDFHYVVSEVLHQPVRYVWHRDTNLAGFDCLILPGGFSYGDYLRAGAIAGRSPVVEALREFVAGGGLVLGSCHGFQILCEAGLLPGGLTRKIGRAACRERGEISVVAGSLKKKKERRGEGRRGGSNSRRVLRKENRS